MPSAPQLADFDAGGRLEGATAKILGGLLGAIGVAMILESPLALGVKGYFFFAGIAEPLRSSFESCNDSFILGFFTNSFLIAFVGYCLYYGLVVVGALLSTHKLRTSLEGFDGSFKQLCEAAKMALGILLLPLLLPANFITSGMMCFLVLVGVIFDGGESSPGSLPFYPEFYEFDYTNCINTTSPEGQQVLEVHQLATFIYKFETASFYFLGFSCCLLMLLFMIF